MTDFEQQVAEALRGARRAWRPIDMHRVPDLMDWLAPRVAAAIEAASEDVFRAVAPQGVTLGDMAQARQEARESALRRMAE